MNDSGLLGFLNTVIVEITDPCKYIFTESTFTNSTPIIAYTPNGKVTLQNSQKTTIPANVFQNLIGRRNVINSVCIVDCKEYTTDEHDNKTFPFSKKYKISKCDFAKGHEVDEFGVLKNITVEDREDYYFDILNNAQKKRFTNSAKTVSIKDVLYIINQTDNKNDKDIILSSIDLYKAKDLKTAGMFNVMLKTTKDNSHNDKLLSYLEDTLKIKTLRNIKIVNHDYINSSHSFAFDKADTALKVLDDLKINYTIDENKYAEQQKFPIDSQDKLCLSNNCNYKITLTGPEKEVKKTKPRNHPCISISIPTTQEKYTDDFWKIVHLNNDFHKNKTNDNETLNNYVFNIPGPKINIIEDDVFKSINDKKDTVFKCYIKDITDKSFCYFYETDNSNTDENIIILKPIELKIWISNGKMKTSPTLLCQEKIKIISKSNAEKLKKEQKRSLIFNSQYGQTYYKIYGFKNTKPEYIFFDGMYTACEQRYIGKQYKEYDEVPKSSLSIIDIQLNDLDTK